MTAVRFRRARRRGWLPPGDDRFIGHPAIQVVGQCPVRRIAVLGPVGHGFFDDRLQGRVNARVELERRPEVASLPGADHLDHVAREWRLTGQAAVERRAQAVDIGSRSQPFELSLGLLGAHIGRSTQCTARKRLGTPAG